MPVSDKRAREVARQLGHTVPEPEQPATTAELTAIAERYGVRPDLLAGRSRGNAEDLAAAIHQHTHGPATPPPVVPDTAEQASRLPSREQARAADAEAREAAAIEAHPDVVDARQAAEQAAVSLSDLERRVVEGDGDVTVDDTGKAREAARFAQLKLSAARKRIREQRELHRRQQRADVVAQVRASLTETHGPAVLAGLRDAALDSLTAYLAAVGARNDALRQAYSLLRSIGVPRHDSAHFADAAGDDTALLSYNALQVDGQEYEPLQPEKLVDHLVWKAARTAGVRGTGSKDMRVEAKNTLIPSSWQ
ncbi:hypothetical protein ACFU9W_19055 [Streptomyces sp. NPDC057600]|uniref:hypothetical protein n=1 Tax=Streptomyces sp. NPDC057600 TaxID=3346180 RepID=UPI0036BB497B